MSTKKLCAFSLVAALSLSATTLAAQARIPVRKDTVTRTTSSGEVTPAPTPMPAPAPAPVVETARTETVVQTTTTVAETVPMRRGMFGNNLYVGLAGGVLVPTGDLRNGYGAGFNGTGVFGWERPSSVLGLRGLVSYGQVKGGDIPSSSTAQNPDAAIASVLGHLKLKVPFAGLYLLGGGGWNQVKNYNSASFETGNVSGSYVTVNNWSVDGGVGVDIPMGMASLFVEGRMSRIFSNEDTTPAASSNRNTGVAPIIIGFRVF